MVLAVGRHEEKQPRPLQCGGTTCPPPVCQVTEGLSLCAKMLACTSSFSFFALAGHAVSGETEDLIGGGRHHLRDGIREGGVDVLERGAH